MSNQPPPSAPSLASPLIMFISAALFGYFGFAVGLTTQNAAGQFVLFFGLLVWTLKASTVGFGLAGVITLVVPWAGNLLYAFTSVAGAVLFIVVAVLDVLDTTHAAAVHPLLLLIFAVWNGHGGWTGLRGLLAAHERPGESFEAP